MNWQSPTNSSISSLASQVKTLESENAALRQERDAAYANWNAQVAFLGDTPTAWRCFHCGKTCATVDEAVEHFGGDRNNPRPARCQEMLDAICATFEAVGIHRNFHNAASVRELARQRDEAQKLAEETMRLHSTASDALGEALKEAERLRAENVRVKEHLLSRHRCDNFDGMEDPDYGF